ncbi:MAG TPA: YbhB/YbcL family Raf kinase inhibitor-like protein [Thermoanaerobaculia bacterium]|nr:YbhB/YbcL family Raf kinase inhibitor-like protein [Thermoanaerobaculia bacterium]
MAEFVLRSSAFQEGAAIPRKHTCDGEDVSPELSWSGQPSQTASLALIVEDPDAPRKTWVHWVLFDMPAARSSLPDSVSDRPAVDGGGTQGKNDFGNLGYGGPCPPSGTHRYFFKLYALNKKLGLPSGSSRHDVDKAMEGHVLAEAQLLGRYSRGR